MTTTEVRLQQPTVILVANSWQPLFGRSFDRLMAHRPNYRVYYSTRTFDYALDADALVEQTQFGQRTINVIATDNELSPNEARFAGEIILLKPDDCDRIIAAACQDMGCTVDDYMDVYGYENIAALLGVEGYTHGASLRETSR